MCYFKIIYEIVIMYFIFSLFYELLAFHHLTNLLRLIYNIYFKL